jgi:hypothetical protein
MKTIVKTPKKIEKVVEVVTESVDTVVDVEGGYITMLDKEVYVICTSYAYTGTLSGVNNTFLEISNPSIVYDSGPWTAKKFSDVQALPTKKVVIQLSQIESTFVLER